MRNLAGDRRALGAITCVLVVFALRLALALASVPPWQNPDEPQHVMAVWLTGAEDRSPEAIARMEEAVIDSMARHRWWSLVGERTPNPLPSRFDEDEALRKRWIAMPRNDGLYYAVAARLAYLETPESVLLSARLLSAASGLGILLLSFATGRILLGAWHAVGMMTVLALHPQFVLVATTASADAFIGLLSSLMFWMVVRSISSPLGPLWLTAALVPTSCAVLSRRLGFTVVLVAGWSVCAAMLARRWRIPVGFGLLASALLPTAVAGLLWQHPDFVKASIDEVMFWWVRRPGHFDFVAGILGLYRSGWLAAGWLTFPAGDSWLVVGAFLLVTAGAGVARTLLGANARWRVPVCIGAGCVAVQIALLLARQYAMGEVSQARYLMPVVVPLSLTIWLGVLASAAPRRRGLMAALLVLWLGAFDASSWAQVIWPAFL